MENKFNKIFAEAYLFLIIFLLILFDIFDWPLKYLLFVTLIVIIIFIVMSFPLMDYVMKKFYNVKFENEIPDYLKEFIQDICDTNNRNFLKLVL